MRVLVNAISAKMGGFRTLIISFIENIEDNDGNEYVFLCPEGIINKKLFIKKNTKVIETNIGNMNHIKRFFWYQFSLPRYIKDNKFDYMINLTNYGPLQPGCKEILLLHNPKHISDEIKRSFCLKNRIKLILQDIVFLISLKGSHKLVVQTNYMKQGVINKFKCNEDKIVIIPSAPSRINESNYSKTLEKNLNDFIGNEKNIFSNITLYSVHKNLELLLRAIKYIKDNDLVKLKLILTISENENEEAKKLIDLIKKYRIDDYVGTVGNVKHDYIHQILNKSMAFIFPSYAESFGIPFVEAMRFGVPIIAADLGFAHDVCDDAAVYFKYDNYIDLGKKIVEITKDTKLRQSLAHNSNRRNELFDEQNIVRDYLKLIK